MSFLNRLSLYLIGIVIGLFVLWFSLQFRQQPIKFHYLPNARVINHILKKNINISDHVHCKMLCYSIDSLLLRQYIEQSKVDFTKSQTRNKVCKKYYLNNNSVNLIIANCNDTFHLTDLIIEDVICGTCN